MYNFKISCDTDKQTHWKQKFWTQTQKTEQLVEKFSGLRIH